MLSKSPTTVSRTSWNLPGTIVNLGMKNNLHIKANSISMQDTMNPASSPGLTSSPNRLTLLTSCSTASRITTWIVSSSSGPPPVIIAPAMNTRAMTANTIAALRFSCLVISSTPFSHRKTPSPNAAFCIQSRRFSFIN